jgi:hypothetical protein
LKKEEMDKINKPSPKTFKNKLIKNGGQSLGPEKRAKKK